MTEVLERILRAYGQTVTLTHAVSPLGFADDRRWRCVTRMAVDDGDRVAFQGRSFRVRNARAVYLGGELCHYEAILTAEGEAAE